MLTIRLQRVGRRNDPSFRVIVTEHTEKPKTGNFLEILGSYDARKGEPQLKADRIKHWISVGAQTSDTVHNLLVRAGIIEGKTVNPLPKKTPIKKEEENTEESGTSAPVGDQPSEETPAEGDVEKGTPAEPVAEETPEEPKEEVEEETKTSEAGSSDQPEADLGK